MPIKEERCSDIVNTKQFRRRRRRRFQASTRRRSIDTIIMTFSLLLIIALNDPRDYISQQQQQQRDPTPFVALALMPRTKFRERHSVSRCKASSSSLPSSSSNALNSPLFSNRITTPSPRKVQNRIGSQSRQAQSQGRRHDSKSLFSSRSSSLSSISSPTALHMVLTTPESIIEQASTVNLLDDLINESVRTSARRPIMMQFDPSSGWIWRRWKGTVFAETWTSCGK